MRVLGLNITGTDVTAWQTFLVGRGLLAEITGTFDAATDKATRDFQRQHRLTVDGEAGEATFSVALQLGLSFGDAAHTEKRLPPRPSFGSPTQAQRTVLFGEFHYQPAGGGNIRITDNWVQENVRKVFLPGLAGKKIAPADGKILFHKLAIPQLVAMFEVWEQRGLLNRILTWAGSFVPRMIRGSSIQLSSHAFASAFDINAAWNGLGVRPPLLGKPGSVVELVPIANAFGFFWGGHYVSRPDGMHFEVARILDAAEIEAVKTAWANVPIHTPTTNPDAVSPKPPVKPIAEASPASNPLELDPPGVASAIEAPPAAPVVVEKLEVKTVDAPPAEGVTSTIKSWVQGTIASVGITGTLAQLVESFDLVKKLNLSVTILKWVVIGLAASAVLGGTGYLVYVMFKKIIRTLVLLKEMQFKADPKLHDVTVKPQ